ncbi:unnamed protein product [Blumeria hordei]|uniref:Uncharacterized protein n=1 Tax=Blumeria hordei TaxID=2867405 RepID=A0A383UGA2_BLUHO|nr:unnamed protein product [Blumeria hordei]
MLEHYNLSPHLILRLILSQDNEVSGEAGQGISSTTALQQNRPKTEAPIISRDSIEEYEAVIRSKTANDIVEGWVTAYGFLSFTPSLIIQVVNLATTTASSSQLILAKKARAPKNDK